MDDLDRLLPDRIRIKAIATPQGTELLFAYPDVLEVIELATDHSIAILGVEVFQIEPEGLLVERISDYEVPFSGDWAAFVRSNNAQVKEIVQQEIRGEGHGSNNGNVASITNKLNNARTQIFTYNELNHIKTAQRQYQKTCPFMWNGISIASTRRFLTSPPLIPLRHRRPLRRHWMRSGPQRNRHASVRSTSSAA